MHLAPLARLALSSPCHQRHVALIVSGGRILSWATNTRERHAEVRALRKLGLVSAAGCTLISLRLTPAGMLGNSRPCPACMGALIDARIGVVEFFEAGGFHTIEID